VHHDAIPAAVHHDATPAAAVRQICDATPAAAVRQHQQRSTSTGRAMESTPLFFCPSIEKKLFYVICDL